MPTTEAPPTTTVAAPPPVRASDAEREATVAALHRAMADGCLDLAETEERVAAAYAARNRDDLPALLADLPHQHRDGAAGPGAPTWAALWRSVVWRARTTLLDPAAAGSPPDDRQCRTASMLAVLAVLWMVVCAFLGAWLVSR